VNGEYVDGYKKPHSKHRKRVRAKQNRKRVLLRKKGEKGQVKVVKTGMETCRPFSQLLVQGKTESGGKTTDRGLGFTTIKRGKNNKQAQTTTHGVY